MNQAVAIPVIRCSAATSRGAIYRCFPFLMLREQKRSHGHQHPTTRGGLAICALVALTLAQFLCAASARAQVKHTVIAASGTAAPSGGNYLGFGTAALGPAGQVAFDAILVHGGSSTGVFLGDGATTTTIALGSPASNLGFVSTPTISAEGEVIFEADNGIFRGNGTSITPIVQIGDAAPGGGNFGLFTSNHVANPRGVIAYSASVIGGVSTTGIFRTAGAQTVAIAADNTLAPTGGTYSPSPLGNAVINQRGQVAFFANLIGGSADFAVFRGDGEKTTTIFAANQSAPGGGTFQDFGEVALNRFGQVLTLGQLQNVATNPNLYRGDGKESVAIARLGDAAPNGETYAQEFSGPLVLNDRGEAAFAARLTGGASGKGIFRGDGITTTTVALTGAPAPGTSGTFNDFFDTTMDNDGKVAFVATLTPGIGGFNTSNNFGIWVGTSEKDLRLVVLVGQIIGAKPLTCLPRDAGHLQMNELGLLWIGGCGRRNGPVVFSTFDDEADQR